MRRQEPRLRNLALDLGLLGGHVDYTRFIILARSRTGSNLLRGLLNSHSGVLTFGEIFRNTDQVDFAVPRYETSRRMLALYQRDPLRFLSEHVFRRLPAQYKAVGFKLFYYHARIDPWRGVWTYLQGMPQLRVIHLKRRNMLSTHLSRARAERSDRWVNTSGEREETGPIALDYEACRSDFVRTQQWEEDGDRMFREHPKLDLYYEDLAGAMPQHLAELQSFLGLPPEALAPATHKQSQQPLSAAIANYAELKQAFAGTAWARFFEE